MPTPTFELANMSFARIMQLVGTRGLIAIALVAASLLGVRLALHTVRPAWWWTHPTRERIGKANRDEAQTRLPHLEDIHLRTTDGIDLVGWFAPGPKRTAVILVHGLGGNRAQLLDEAAALARHGHGVLLYDSRACGDSTGTVATWGDQERRDVRAAFEFLTRRPDVDPASIGLFGHSVGSSTVALFAAEEPRVRAVALGPIWPSLSAEIGDKFRLRNAKIAPLAKLVFRYAGVDVAAVSAEAAVPHIPPRPLLIVSGTDDVDTPQPLMRELAALAPGAEFWSVAGAGHGGFAKADPKGIDDRFAAFFDRALGPSR
ncbi:MAG: alpha/beta fold hydrolase [Proteobacteria bacterium]|nr:alpha/beta fold hydrolase [Pseudomonadota bacterium]